MSIKLKTPKTVADRISNNNDPRLLFVQAKKRRPDTVNTLKTVKRLQAEARRQNDVLDKLSVAYRLYSRIGHQLYKMTSVDPQELFEILRSMRTRTWSEAVIRLIFNDPNLSCNEVSQLAKVISYCDSLSLYVHGLKIIVSDVGGIEQFAKMYKPSRTRNDVIDR